MCDCVLINHGMYTATLDDHWFFIPVWDSCAQPCMALWISQLGERWKGVYIQMCDCVLINHGMYTATLDDHWFFIWDSCAKPCIALWISQLVDPISMDLIMQQCFCRAVYYGIGYSPSLSFIITYSYWPWIILQRSRRVATVGRF